MNKLFIWVMFVLLLLVIVVWYQWPTEQVRVTLCDVGQGDGIVFSQGFSQMVVDVGPENDTIDTCLGKIMPFWDRNVEVVVITHADSDHIGGLNKLLQTYRVNEILTTQAAKPKVEMIVGQQSRIAVTWQGQQWNFGDISGEVMWPEKISEATSTGQTLSNRSDTNGQSLVLRLVAGTNKDSFWLSGDADVFVENRLIAQNLVKPTTFLKAGHHGSKTSSSEPFLTILQPREIWISVGKNNRYGHPATEVLDLFQRFHIPVVRTDLSGTVTQIF